MTVPDDGSPSIMFYFVTHLTSQGINILSETYRMKQDIEEWFGNTHPDNLLIYGRRIFSLDHSSDLSVRMHWQTDCEAAAVMLTLKYAR